MGDEAGVDGDDVVRAQPAVPGPAVGDRQPDGGAEARPWAARGPSTTTAPATPPARVSASTAIWRLSARCSAGAMCCHEQPPQPAGDVRAGRLDPTGRGLVHPLDDGACVPVPLLDHPGHDRLARQRAADEDDAARRLPGHRLAAGRHRRGPQLHAARARSSWNLRGRGLPSILMADRAAPRIQIAPSILPADLARLGEEVEALEAAGCDRIQWDIMDGQFVPNITVGPDVVAAARRHTSLPFEAHLMTLTPELLAAEFVRGRLRAADRPRRVGDPPPSQPGPRPLGRRDRRRGAGPGHPGHRRAPRARPGRPGARHDREPRLRRPGLPGHHGAEGGRGPGHGPGVGLRRSTSRSTAASAPTTVAGAAAAGANVLVAGSALFRHPDGLEAAVAELRALAEAAFPWLAA